jgi:2-haloacid dehalogenase
VAVRAVLLDVNETLFSLDAVRDRLERAGIGAEELPAWFAQVLRDGFAAAAADAFAAFPEIARYHLQELARRDAIEDPDWVAGEVLEGFTEVEPHEDVQDGLAALADAGLVIATFTNGSVEITRRFLEEFGLTDHVDHLLDVTGPQVWKPHASAYRWACDRIGVRAGEAALVAVHPWDVQGAQHAGLTGCWLDRAGDTPWPPFFAAPDVTVDRLGDVAAELA